MSDLPDTRHTSPPASQGHTASWNLRLSGAGQTPTSFRALTNLTQLCETYLAGHDPLESIGRLAHPQLSSGGQILAIPTLMRTLREPLRKITGALSNTARVLVGLDLRPRT